MAPGEAKEADIGWAYLALQQGSFSGTSPT